MSCGKYLSISFCCWFWSGTLELQHEGLWVRKQLYWSCQLGGLEGWSHIETTAQKASGFHLVLARSPQAMRVTFYTINYQAGHISILEHISEWTDEKHLRILIDWFHDWLICPSFLPWYLLGSVLWVRIFAQEYSILWRWWKTNWPNDTMKDNFSDLNPDYFFPSTKVSNNFQKQLWNA